jgi:plastocyanin
MTDTTTTTDEPEGEPDQPAGVEAPPEAEVEAQIAAGEPVPFWHRPYVERYLVPLVLPLVVVVVIVVYVLNVSRLFLSAHGHIPVIIGTVITLVILTGAALLASAPRMRQVSVILLTAGFLVSLSFAGWISLGHSENKNATATTLPPTLNAKQAKDVTAGPGTEFRPAALTAQTGLVKFNITFAGSHTFGFHEATTLFPELKAAAPKESAVAYFGAPGTYNYFCSIPGHEAAGMKGVVTVTGPAVPLEKALVDAGNPPTAAAGGGGGG